VAELAVEFQLTECKFLQLLLGGYIGVGAFR
jgi:hypothetical protein